MLIVTLVSYALPIVLLALALTALALGHTSRVDAAQAEHDAYIGTLTRTLDEIDARIARAQIHALMQARACETREARSARAILAALAPLSPANARPVAVPLARRARGIRASIARLC